MSMLLSWKYVDENEPQSDITIFHYFSWWSFNVGQESESWETTVWPIYPVLSCKWQWYIRQPEAAREPGKTCWAVKAMMACLEVKTGSTRHYAFNHRRKPSHGIALQSTVRPLPFQPFAVPKCENMTALGWAQAWTPEWSFHFGNWPFELSFLSSHAQEMSPLYDML